MRRAMSHIPESEQTVADKEKAFVDIFGPDNHGRVRTYGCGPSPTDIFGSSSTKVVTTHSEKMKEMIESEVAARMVEYEKHRKEETTTQLKQLLEAAGIKFPFQESTVTKVSTTSSFERDRNDLDDIFGFEQERSNVDDLDDLDDLT